MKVTITEKHLNNAISAVTSSERYLQSRHCVVGQALQEAYGSKFWACTRNQILIGELTHLPMPTDGEDLIALFDNYEYTTIRALLPLTIEFPEVA